MLTQVLPEMIKVWPEEENLVGRAIWNTKPMKVVYIAGAFRAPTQNGIHKHVELARQASLKLWKEGYAVICPHIMTETFQGECSDEVWLKGCAELLKRCDEVYVLKNWHYSQGSIDEIKLARDLGMKVRYEEDEMSSLQE